MVLWLAQAGRCEEIVIEQLPVIDRDHKCNLHLGRHVVLLVQTQRMGKRKRSQIGSDLPSCGISIYVR